MRTVRIISATTKDRNNFEQYSLLGRSLLNFPSCSRLELNIFFSNYGEKRLGLSEIYNRFLHEEYKEEILLFVHDDVFINDWHIVHRLNDAVRYYDVVGIVGNTNPDFDEPSWNLAWDRVKYPNGLQPDEYKAGTLCHINQGGIIRSYYGETPQTCKLLDGLFLALDTERILESSIKFDEQFDFHFYDLDFCRACLSKNLILGTWPIAVTHDISADFNSPEWISAKEKYLLKWR
jgi:hypothetical protein